MATWGPAREFGRDAGLEGPGASRRPRRQDRSDRERERDRVLQIVPEAIPDIERAVGMLPTSSCLMTSGFENRRSGILVSRVMRCSGSPVCVCVAVPIGQRLATLIRDSRAFALCAVDRGNRLLMRKFAEDDGGLTAPSNSDPFDTLETMTLVTGSPILKRSSMVLDCQVIRHMDLESDHEIYVGMVLNARVTVPESAGGSAPYSAIAPSNRPGEDSTPGAFAQ